MENLAQPNTTFSVKLKKMKKLTNMELFNGITGKLFAALYQNFPQETQIDHGSFLEDFIDPDDFDGAFNMPDMTKATLEWLDKAGYIWLKPPKAYSGTYFAILSPKGLEALNVVPDSLEPGKTLGEKIIDFSKDQFGEGMNQLVKAAITEGINLILKS